MTIIPLDFILVGLFFKMLKNYIKNDITKEYEKEKDMSSRIELEASYILGKDYSNIYEKIRKENFIFISKNIEEDTYYTDKEETFIKDRICLRTRKIDENFLELTYKPKVDDKLEKYGKKEINIELKVEDYNDIKYIIEELGYIQYVSFKKHRETFSKQIDGVEYNIMIDKIENVGSFIELEILTDTEENKEKLATKLDEFVEKFECDKLEEKMLPYRDIVKNYKGE